MNPSNPTQTASQTSPRPKRGRWPIGRWLLTSVILLAVYVGITMLSNTSRAQWKWAEALQALDAGEIEQAKQYAQEALEIAPEDPLLRLYAGELYYRLDEPEKAHQQIDQAIALDENNAYVLTTGSFLLARLGDHEKSLALSDKLVELAQSKRAIHPHQAENHRAYAIALAADDGEASQQRIQQGLTDIEAALAVFENNHAPIGKQVASYIDTRGYLKLFAGEPEEALADLNTAIAIYEKDYDQLLSKLSPEQIENKPLHVLAYEDELRDVLAVLYWHRSQVYEKLNLPEEAEHDWLMAKKFGLSRTKGIW
ncbi:tetratricopeptide repeat protein [Blastopirellula marina]|uniref:Uncharacterized protein n=1 Tax=Blastopirellula marina TaxID=124 RepID=A0A2S8GNL4_9BACT|nr:tetratricopeptide repeat protein [Blastopirellula marina]PQO46036.1 hypothetical protein C5Y93_10665 [Blastopirellula marina]